MSTEADRIQIVLEAQGRQQVAELTAVIEAERAALVRLDGELKAGGISATHHAQQTADAKDRIKDMRAALAALTPALGSTVAATTAAAAATRGATAAAQQGVTATAAATAATAANTAAATANAAAAERAARANRSMAAAARNTVEMTDPRKAAGGRAVLELSRGIEDFSTGGPMGALNNIPGVFREVATYAGMSTVAIAGMTGAVSGVATGAYLLWRNWDSVVSLFDAGHVETEAARMERLEKATSRTAAETAKLNTYKREQSALDGAAGPERQVVATTAAAVDVVKENGGLGKLAANLAAARNPNGQRSLYGRLDGNEQYQLGQIDSGIRSRGNAKVGQTPKRRAQLEREMEAMEARGGALIKKAWDAELARAREDIGKALADPKRLQALVGTIGREAEKFAPGLADKLKVEAYKASKEGVGVAKMMDEQGASADLYEARRAEKLKDTQDLNEQGAENQRHMLEEMSAEAIKGVGKIYADPLRDQLVKDRAAGMDNVASLAKLSGEVEAQVRRLAPGLAAFPATMAGVVREIALDVRKSADMAVAELKAAEGLTDVEANRRLDQQRKKKAETARNKLADDEVGQFVETQHKRARKLNPDMPELTAERREQLVREQRQQLDALGLSAADQAKLGKTLNDPKRSKRADGVMARLAEAGVGQADALRLLPEVFDNAGGGGTVALNRASRIAAANLGRRKKRGGASADRTARDLANAPGGGLRNVGVAPRSMEDQLNRLMVEAAAGGKPGPRVGDPGGPPASAGRPDMQAVAVAAEARERTVLRSMSPAGPRRSGGPGGLADGPGADGLGKIVEANTKALEGVRGALDEANRNGVPIKLR